MSSTCLLYVFFHGEGHTRVVEVVQGNAADRPADHVPAAEILGNEGAVTILTVAKGRAGLFYNFKF